MPDSRSGVRSVATGSSSTHPHWWSSVEPVEWVALAAGSVPIVVAFVWALSTGWVPLSDTGQLVVRSRDVFTANHPFVGAWSSRSSAIDGNINNLGALQLVLLAPFSRLSPTWGAALGTCALAGVSVVGVWASARSVLGRLGAVGAMVATLLLIGSMGNLLVLETRQQVAMLLPFWCLLWAAVALWRGRIWAAPLVVFTASLVVQTHFTFIFQALTLAAAATIAHVVGQRDRLGRRDVRCAWGVAVLTGLVVWAPSLWDQFFGTGNLGSVASQSGSGGGPGLGAAIEIMGKFTLRQPFWMPGSMGRTDRGTPISVGSNRPDALTWLTIACWVALPLAVWGWARVRNHRGISALAGVSAVALLGGVVAVDKIPPLVFDVYASQNYYWLWPVALLAGLAPVAMAAASDPTVALLDRRRMTAASAVALTVAVMVATPVANHLPFTQRETFQMQPAARSLLRQLDRSLDRQPIDGPVLISYEGDLFNNHRYTFLAELQSHGVPFTFDREDANLFRFGRRRCVGPSVDQELLFTGGVTATLPVAPGAELLARTDTTPQRRAALVRADAGAGDAIRSGTIAVDLAVWRQRLPGSIDAIEAVIETPGRPATGLFAEVQRAESLGVVELRAGSADLIRRWAIAQRVVAADQSSLTLAPVDPGTVRTCP